MCMIRSSETYLLSVYYVPGTVLSVGCTRSVCLHGTSVQRGCDTSRDTKVVDIHA